MFGSKREAFSFLKENKGYIYYGDGTLKIVFPCFLKFIHFHEMFF